LVFETASGVYPHLSSSVGTNYL